MGQQIRASGAEKAGSWTPRLLRCAPIDPLVRGARLKDPDEGLSQLAKSYRAAEPWLSAVWQFTGSALFGVGVGYGLDKWLGIGPIGLIVGGLGGSAVGFYAFIRKANQLMEQQKKEEQQKKDEKKP